MRLRWLLVAVAAGGCEFVVDPLLPLGGDGAALAFDAAAGKGDAAAKPFDAAAAPPDLARAPDLAPPFLPSHVSPGYFGVGAGDLSVAAAIDTDALTVDGQGPPAGTAFVDDGGLAV